jgi:hypothetical protein
MPSAREGLTVNPSGRVTTVFLGSVSAIAPVPSNPWLGNFSSKSRPLGFSASFVVGWEAIFGWKGTPSQPTVGAGCPAAFSALTVSPRKTPGLVLESTSTVVSGAAPQEVGMVRYGRGCPSEEQP